MELHYRAWREGHKIYQELRVGDADDGISIDGKARDLLKAVYLKPLRDAEREIPEKLTQEKMFDVELYGLKTDEKKKVELSNKIENDSFLGYIVRAIKYASGIEE